MPSTDWASLTPEQRAAWNRAILRDAEHVGIHPDLAQALCMPGSFATLDGKPIKPGTRLPDGGAMLVVSTPCSEKDRVRDLLPSTTAPLPPVWTKAMFHGLSAEISSERERLRRSNGEEAARFVAHYVRADLEQRYPDAVNARCTHMAGEQKHLGVLAVTWMRGREVFHRRHEVDADFVLVRGARHFASWLLPAIHQQIQSTEGAERP